jgi:hypothetical protein
VDQGGGKAQDEAVGQDRKEDRPQQDQGQLLPQIPGEKGGGGDEKQEPAAGA